NSFSLHVVHESFLVQHEADGGDRIGKQVNVDIRALSHVSGQDTADQPRTEASELLHDPQGFNPHVEEVLALALAFVESSERLNFVADFPITWQVSRLHPTLANSPSCLHFRSVVFTFLTIVHESSGFPSDLPPQLRGIHAKRRCFQLAVARASNW